MTLNRPDGTTEYYTTPGDPNLLSVYVWSAADQAWLYRGVVRREAPPGPRKSKRQRRPVCAPPFTPTCTLRRNRMCAQMSSPTSSSRPPGRLQAGRLNGRGAPVRGTCPICASRIIGRRDWRGAASSPSSNSAAAGCSPTSTTFSAASTSRFRISPTCRLTD